MDFSSLNPIGMIVLLMGAATPIILAALGELVVEKSGVLNLGVEGMMIIGAVTGFIIATQTSSPYLGMLAAIVSGAMVASIFAVLTQFLLSNQVATGLALTLFGLGLAAMLGGDYVGIVPPQTPSLNIPGISDLPIVGELLFSHDPVIYFSIFMVFCVWYFLNRTRSGLILRACGENHDAAHSLGYNVVMIRFGAILFGGACAGLGGAYISLIRVPFWVEGITAGSGWIALAIVVFASWKPWRVVLGAYLFGGITILQISLQALGISISEAYMAVTPYLIMIFFVAVVILPTKPSQIKLGIYLFGGLTTLVVGLNMLGISISAAYLSMTPYVVTIVVLVIMSADRKRASLNAPACLGRSFHASN